jgi:hypothetical protein
MAYIYDLYSFRAQKLPPYKLVTGETQTWLLDDFFFGEAGGQKLRQTKSKSDTKVCNAQVLILRKRWQNSVSCRVSLDY